MKKCAWMDAEMATKKGRGVKVLGEREETSEWYEGSVAPGPPYMPRGQSPGPTLARSNYHGPLAQPEGSLELAVPSLPHPYHCLSPPSTLQSFPHLHLLVFSHSSPFSPALLLPGHDEYWESFRKVREYFADSTMTWPVFKIVANDLSCSISLPAAAGHCVTSHFEWRQNNITEVIIFSVKLCRKGWWPLEGVREGQFLQQRQQRCRCSPAAREGVTFQALWIHITAVRPL